MAHESSDLGFQEEVVEMVEVMEYKSLNLDTGIAQEPNKDILIYLVFDGCAWGQSIKDKEHAWCVGKAAQIGTERQVNMYTKSDTTRTILS
jgi:hypothetical protein